MKSQHVEQFNHDADAESYDEDVKNEQDPIRTGYQKLLNWVAKTSNQQNPQRVLELGTGTGNLSRLLKGYQKLICVDASAQMLEQAKKKLKSRSKIQFHQGDLLEYFDQSAGSFDAVVSTYAIHHLLETEKKQLFQKMATTLNDDGFAVFGDLMFQNPATEAELLSKFREAEQVELLEDIRDEFFWYIDTSLDMLQEIGFEVTVQRFSELSWGLLVTR